MGQEDADKVLTRVDSDGFTQEFMKMEQTYAAVVAPSRAATTSEAVQGVGAKLAPFGSRKNVPIGVRKSHLKKERKPRELETGQAEDSDETPLLPAVGESPIEG